MGIESSARCNPLNAKLSPCKEGLVKTASPLHMLIIGVCNRTHTVVCIVTIIMGVSTNEIKPPHSIQKNHLKAICNYMEIRLVCIGMFTLILAS